MIIEPIATLGLIIYENTIAYFLISKSNHNFKHSLVKMATLPSIYTCVLGVIINKTKLIIPVSIVDTISYFRGAYVVLGMMVIGIALSAVTKASIDYKFGILAFSAKFIAYPVLFATIIYLDNQYFQIFAIREHNVMLVLSAVPMAANVVAFASSLKVHPEKIAAVVFASTVFAIVYLPIFVAIFIK